MKFFKKKSYGELHKEKQLLKAELSGLKSRAKIEEELRLLKKKKRDLKGKTGVMGRLKGGFEEAAKGYQKMGDRYREREKEMRGKDPYGLRRKI